MEKTQNATYSPATKSNLLNFEYLIKIAKLEIKGGNMWRGHVFLVFVETKMEVMNDRCLAGIDL